MANHRKCDPEKLAEIARLAPTAKSAAQIAKRIGIAKPTVALWAAKAGITLPRGKAAREYDSSWPLARIEMPAWVPPHLEDEFWRVAEAEGEHEACARVRKLKAAERAFTTGAPPSGGGRRVMGMASFGRSV